MAETAPPEYVPPGPLETAPGGGYRDPEERREALAATLSGAETGDWDEEVLDWLARLDDSTCRTVASLLWRARLAGRAEAAQPPEGTVTEWGVRFDGPPPFHSELSAYDTEAEARHQAAITPTKVSGWSATVMSRPVGPWTEAPEPAEDEGDDRQA